MRFYITLTVLLFSWIAGTAHAACPDAEFASCEKTYVQNSQIDFAQNKILVKLGSNVICTSAIYSDQGGYYFKDYQKKCEDDEWQCKHCDTCNPIWNTLCKKCSRVNWSR